MHDRQNELKQKSGLSLFNTRHTAAFFGEDIVTNPDRFMQKLLSQQDWSSFNMAEKLDEADPLHETTYLFKIAELEPFAGHSLGPVFTPALDKMTNTAEMQLRLHEGHFPDHHPEGAVSGHWFDCDRHQPSLEAAKALLGFEEDTEFVFTASGLSQNLGMLMDTFYRPSKKDWEAGKTKMVLLDTEFFSDQAESVSVLKRAIATADAFECFTNGVKPTPENLLIRIKPDDKGLFDTQRIIDVIKAQAHEIKMICLSDIVFSTGQRLELEKISRALAAVIQEHKIIVGLDLAHTVGNRPINLKSLPVTFAVGCGYKHLTGFPGSGFGIYVSKHADLQKYPPLQGWKAADSSRVFPTINHYDPAIMAQAGAVAFRASNPPPMALIPVQTFLTHFNHIGFDKCFNKSECLTRYMVALLKQRFNDEIEMITPEDPTQRGAMIVFQIKGISEVKKVEDFLKGQDLLLGSYEIDVRPPNNIRLTAHYAYTTFRQINRMIDKLCVAVAELKQQHQCRV